MHEFSICTNIVESVIAEYEKIEPGPVRLLKVRVVVGKLHQIVPETLLSAYEVLTKGTIAENSQMEIEFVDVCCQCNKCLWEGEIDYPFFICKECGSGDIALIHGKELYLKNLEVEYDETG
ncbi:MAG: hydrogenase maturation nickel metallochaperone HypA [Spirochaetales bacterium]|nr:hydrogenase maturation nickel metallochaperone HypA [Spirochaetales bacterium]